jgi:adenylate cyclase
VLPFIAGDGPQSGLAAAVAERLTSALARARWLNVVGPKRDAPAEYVVRGRVQNLGARVQVSVRLCHAGTGRHIWGDAFDAAPESAGELQERVTQGAINRILPHLREAASTRPEGWIAPHPTAVACVRQALRAVFEITRSASEHALEKLDRAQSLSPEFPLARAVAAWCHALRAGCFFADNVGAERERARHLTALTLSTDNSDPLVLAVLGNAATVFGDLALGEALIGKCLAIDPDSMTAWQRRGWIASYRGRDTALADFRRALALDTGGFERFNTLLGMSWAHMLAGNYAEGAACAAQALRERPSEAWPYRIAAVAQVLSGQMDEARNSVSRLLRQYPDMTAGKIVDALPDQPANGALMAEALASAGLPV